MTFLRWMPFVAALALVLGSPSLAQTPPAPAPAVAPAPTLAPAPAAAPAGTGPLEALRVLDGMWTCARTDATGNLGGIGSLQRVSYTPALGGAWVLQTTIGDITDTPKHTYTGLAYLGYDTLAKKLIVVLVDSRGAYDLAFSSGLSADGAMTWNENRATSDGLPLWHRTFKLLAPNHYLSTFSGPTDLNGTINKIKFSCTKST